MSLSKNQTNPCSIHQFFGVLDDMDQNNEIINNTEMKCIRREIEINLDNWIEATSTNHQKIQRIYRQKVIFLTMRFIELLQTEYNWEYSEEYFPLFDDEWYSSPDCTPNSPDYIENKNEYDRHFYIKGLQQREIQLRKMINNLMILCCCLALAMCGIICFCL